MNFVKISFLHHVMHMLEHIIHVQHHHTHIMYVARPSVDPYIYNPVATSYPFWEMKERYE